MPIFSFEQITPKIDPSAWIAPTASLIGDVTIGAESSIWFQSVLRGDVLPIQVGSRTNIQDLSLAHTSTEVSPCIIGDEVTVGHRVILHGCKVANRVLIGMGSILMDNVEIGEDCIIGAGSLVTEGTVIPSGSLAFGSPCRVKRRLTEAEIALICFSAQNYVERALKYLKSI